MRKFVKKGIGPEGIMHKNFAALIRQYEGYKKKISSNDKDYSVLGI